MKKVCGELCWGAGKGWGQERFASYIWEGIKRENFIGGRSIGEPRKKKNEPVQ